MLKKILSVMMPIANVGAFVGLMPQIWTLYVEKSAKDISLGTVMISVFIQTTMLLNSIDKQDKKMLRLTGTSLSFIAIVVLQILYYRYLY